MNVQLLFDDEHHNDQSIEHKLGFLCDKQAIDFIKQCLKIDAQKRPSCSQLLNHEYFDNFRDWFEDEIQTLIMYDQIEI